MKRATQAYTRLCTSKPGLFPGNFKIYVGALYGRFHDENGNSVFWVCDNYALIKGKIPVHIYDGAEWRLVYVDKANRIYQSIKRAILTIGRVPRVESAVISFADYRQMMKTEPRHKKGTGSRIYTNQINGALKWREVTELAHWEGRGNASMMAEGMRY